MDDLMPVRVLVADDYGRVRQAIRELLRVRERWEVVGEASDGQQAVQLALETAPHLVIIDAAMPTVSGIEATRQIARASPATRIIVLTLHDEERYFVEAIDAGAHAYVLKESADSDLIRAADAVLDGRTFVSSGVDHEFPARYVDPDWASGGGS
jgi:DNA-binding NarL/FixJ family response regulator